MSSQIVSNLRGKTNPLVEPTLVVKFYFYLA
jgi:hypothetical protein